jgi:cyclic pyranopterin monophosphate synthase
MVNITAKNYSHRIATATAVLKTSLAATIEAIEQRKVPKGDVLEFARAAGLLAIKKTSDVIPDCHPLPIESARIRTEIHGLEIHLFVEVETIYKTGVEVEAMHGAAVAALTMYDMLKPLDPALEIGSIRLLEKKGGKGSYKNQLKFPLRAAVVVCSDTIAAGKKTDSAGLAIVEKLKTCGLEGIGYHIIPDEAADIRALAETLLAEGVQLLLFCGGTGLSKRDVTPEALRPLIEREIPGIMEAARQYGQQRMPYAMLSRGIAGMRGDALLLTLPGSTRGASETMDALFPHLLHVFKVMEGARHSD